MVDGRIAAGPLVRRQCERHLADLKAGHERGLTWDRDAALRAIGFFPDVLRLADGEHAGQPFRLSDWQQFVVGSLFGWKGADGCRRYRIAYIEIGKGNGKSPLAAGVGLYMMVSDGEDGAECYAAAVTRDQAKIPFRDAVRMVRMSDDLATRIRVSGGDDPHNLAYLRGGSFFRPISSEGRGLDGKRVHFALIDEVHEHRTSVVVDKIGLGTKGRRQPLIFEITNSGYDRQSVCWQHHEYTRKVLEGTVENDEWFGFVCGLDKGDDWRDEAVWPKANPNLGVSITARYLRGQVREAEGMPIKANIVRRLNFCEWTQQSDGAIDAARWALGDGEVDRTQPRRWHVGVDLSSRQDITAAVAVSKAPDGCYDLVPLFFVPADGARQRAERDGVPYLQWIADGLVIATEGNVVDYGAVRLALNDLADELDLIVDVACDPWNATHMMTLLQEDGFEVREFRQGYGSMAAPTKEFLDLVAAGRIRHGGNPVLAWMAANLSVRQDPAGNLKPAKDRSTGRIDGIVASIMGLGRILVTDHEASSGGAGSYLEQGDLVVL